MCFLSQCLLFVFYYYFLPNAFPHYVLYMPLPTLLVKFKFHKVFLFVFVYILHLTFLRTPFSLLIVVIFCLKKLWFQYFYPFFFSVLCVLIYIYTHFVRHIISLYAPYMHPLSTSHTNWSDDGLGGFASFDLVGWHKSLLPSWKYRALFFTTTYIYIHTDNNCSLSHSLSFISFL